MNETIHVWPEQPSPKHDRCRVASRIEGLKRVPSHLSFEIPSQYLKALTDSADPFLIALIFSAMRAGKSLHIHGAVSPSLLEGLEAFQAAWACWHPNLYRLIDIQADREAEEAVVTGDEAIMGFSGGVDSCFTAWQHTRGHTGRRTKHLTAAVMAHGFDIPLKREEIFDRAAENSRRILESVGLELIPLRCNIRDFGGDWEHTHGAALAACLQLFRARFSTGLIAGTYSLDNKDLISWGSNPLTDSMLSTDSFRLVHDAAEFNREEKSQGIADWPEAMSNLRVCYEGPHWDSNCGQCPKCVLSALCFAVVQSPVPESLNVGPLDRAIRHLIAHQLTPALETSLSKRLRMARSLGIQEPWVDELAALEPGPRGPEADQEKHIMRKVGRKISFIGRAIVSRRS